MASPPLAGARPSSRSTLNPVPTVVRDASVECLVTNLEVRDPSRHPPARGRVEDEDPLRVLGGRSAARIPRRCYRAPVCGKRRDSTIIQPFGKNDLGLPGAGSQGRFRSRGASYCRSDGYGCLWVKITCGQFPPSALFFGSSICEFCICHRFRVSKRQRPASLAAAYAATISAPLGVRLMSP